jgi:hypothetical protein
VTASLAGPGLRVFPNEAAAAPARPVVLVLIPPVSARRHPADLLCGHHYLSSRAALAVVGAVVMDETGAIVDPAPMSKETCDSTPARTAPR